MDHFSYQNINGQQRLTVEDVDLAEIAAAHGTPTYVYSRATLERHYRVFDKAFGDRPHRVCYAVKANSNLAVLNIFARLGSGFDIVSGGELERVIAAGGDPAKVVFSGVGKTREEIRRALEVGIHCFNVESEPELDRIADIAADMGCKAPVSIRVNPDVDAETHPYIATGLAENKFGIDIARAPEVYRHAAGLASLNVIGVDCHIGSQLTKTAPFVDALERVLTLVDELAEVGIVIRHLDIGGGIGVRYRDEAPPQPAEYAKALLPALEGRDLEIIMEPGRAMVANAGILLTRVEYLKAQGEHNFCIVDAAMNDLLRPALYQGWHEVVPVLQREAASTTWDIVGPVCETGDFLAKERELNVQPDDLLAIRSAGAYGMVMASNYNARSRPAEVIVDGSDVHLVRERESLQDQFRQESCLP